MLKREERDLPNSCWNKAEEEESTFIMLGRDLAATCAVYEWVFVRIALGLNKWPDIQIAEAIDRAVRMEREARAALLKKHIPSINKSSLLIQASRLLTQHKTRIQELERDYLNENHTC